MGAIQGHDLMLFATVQSGTSAVFKSLALATNHTLTMNGETVDTSCKDWGKWGHVELNKISWEITSDNLYSEAISDLYGYFIAGTPIHVKFGLKQVTSGTPEEINTTGITESWELDTTKTYFVGDVLITSLNINASDGDNATYSITMSGVSALTKGS